MEGVEEVLVEMWGGRCHVYEGGSTLPSSIIESGVGFKLAAASPPVEPSHQQLLIHFMGTR